MKRVAGTGKTRSIYKILVRERERKRLLARPSHKWRKKKQCEDVEWTNMTQDSGNES
jgi:hypothetical protein